MFFSKNPDAIDTMDKIDNIETFDHIIMHIMDNLNDIEFAKPRSVLDPRVKTRGKTSEPSALRSLDFGLQP